MTAQIAPRIIASDVDGTLLTSEHTISPAVRDAVLAARAAGVPVVLASARGPRAMKHLLAELGSLHTGPFIAFQGALVGQFAPEDELKILHQTRLAVDVARTVVRSAMAAGSTVNWYDAQDWFYSRWDRYGEWESRATGVTPAGQIGFDQLENPDALGPHKLMIPPSLEDPELVPMIAASLPEGAVGHLSGEHYLEITAPEADKSHALVSLCADYDIPLAQAAAVGDGPNDVGMFDVVGTSVAMQNASDAVKARAKWVTASNNDDGLAKAIHRMLSLP